MLSKQFLILLLLLVSFDLKAQEKDPQNMKVAPQNTSCQDLPESYADLGDALKAIEGAKYYFEQEFKTTRESGFQAARFLSCDFETGYILVTYDNAKQIYTGATREFWDRFLASGDQDGFYEKEIRKLQQVPIVNNNNDSK